MSADTSPPIRLLIQGEVARRMTLATFLAANTDGIDPTEAQAIAETIARGGTYNGGGAAAEAFTLEPVTPEPRSAHPAGDLPIARLTDEPLWLRSSSPLRAAVLAQAAAPGAGRWIAAVRHPTNAQPLVLARFGAAEFLLSPHDADHQAAVLDAEVLPHQIGHTLAQQVSRELRTAVCRARAAGASEATPA